MDFVHTYLEILKTSTGHLPIRMRMKPWETVNSTPPITRNKSLGQSFYSVLRDKGVLHSFGYCRGKEDDGTLVRRE